MKDLMKDLLKTKKSGIITYGFTPPKKNFDNEKIIEVAKKQINRINSIKIDALIIYDIQDESVRMSEKRPFPFLETLDPFYFCENYLKEIKLPKILYSCVGKYNQDELKNILKCNEQKGHSSVFVGAAHKSQEVHLNLAEAYNIYNEQNPDVILGAVTIPERHFKRRDEHLKVVDKINNSCKFFVSQAVYNLESAKSFLSDYFYFCQKHEIEMVPIIFTLTPCGSLKTLDFMKWLGISIPIWLENELINANNILSKSINLEKTIFLDLYEYAVEKNIPIGFNIESVSVKKEEIEAAIELVKDIEKIVNNN